MGEAFGILLCRSSRNGFTHRVMVERPTSMAMAATAMVSSGQGPVEWIRV